MSDTDLLLVYVLVDWLEDCSPLICENKKNTYGYYRENDYENKQL